MASLKPPCFKAHELCADPLVLLIASGKTPRLGPAVYSQHSVLLPVGLQLKQPHLPVVLLSLYPLGSALGLTHCRWLPCPCLYHSIEVNSPTHSSNTVSFKAGRPQMEEQPGNTMMLTSKHFPNIVFGNSRNLVPDSWTNSGLSNYSVSPCLL